MSTSINARIATINTANNMLGDNFLGDMLFILQQNLIAESEMGEDDVVDALNDNYDADAALFGINENDVDAQGNGVYLNNAQETLLGRKQFSDAGDAADGGDISRAIELVLEACEVRMTFLQMLQAK